MDSTTQKMDAKIANKKKNLRRRLGRTNACPFYGRYM